MAAVHPAIPLAGVGRMPIVDHQMPQYTPAASLFHPANLPAPTMDFTMTDVSGPLLPPLLQRFRSPFTDDPGIGPWPMDQDTDYIPVITTLLNILRISMEQTVPNGNGTMSSPSSLATAAADVAANAMLTSYHRGFSEGQRLASVNRESTELLVHNSAYAMGVTESVQQAEARFSAVRNQIAFEGYQQGWTHGSETNSANMARAFMEAVTGAAEQAYASGRSQAIAEAQKEISDIRNSAFARGQQSVQKEVEKQQKQEAATSDDKLKVLNKEIEDLQRSLTETKEKAAKTEGGLSTSAATAAATVEKQRLELSSQSDQHREVVENAQRALAQQKHQFREQRREDRQMANQQRRTIVRLRCEREASERTARTQTDQLRSTIQQLISERAENRERASEIAQLHRQGTQLMVQRRTLARRMRQVNRHNAALVEFIRNHRNENLDMQTAHMEVVTALEVEKLTLVAELNAAIRRAEAAEVRPARQLDPYDEDDDGQTQDMPDGTTGEYDDAGADDTMTEDDGEGEGNYDYEFGPDIEYHSDTERDMDAESEGTDTAGDVENGYTPEPYAGYNIDPTAQPIAPLAGYGLTAGAFQMAEVAAHEGDEVDDDLASRFGTVTVSFQASAPDPAMDPLSASLNSASLNDNPSEPRGDLAAASVRDAPAVHDANATGSVGNAWLTEGGSLPFDLPGLLGQLAELAPIWGPARGQPQTARDMTLGANAPYSRNRGSAP